MAPLNIDIHAHFFPGAYLVGADHVVLGRDFCFDMPYQQPVEFIANHEGLKAAERAMILGGAAATLLGL